MHKGDLLERVVNNRGIFIQNMNFKGMLLTKACYFKKIHELGGVSNRNMLLSMTCSLLRLHGNLHT